MSWRYRSETWYKEYDGPFIDWLDSFGIQSWELVCVDDYDLSSPVIKCLFKKSV